MSSIGDLFSSAVDELLSEVARQDSKGPFFAAIKDLRDQRDRDPVAFKQQQQSTQCAEELRGFLRHASEKRKHSTTLKVVTKLEPFISSLCRIAGLCETLLQASPMAVAAVFCGARVLLGVAIKMQECFESILEAISDIDIYLGCYERIFRAHSHSRDMQLKLVTAYKNVLQFWWKATKVLSEKAFVSLAKGIFRPVDHEIADCLRLIKADRESIQFLLVSNEAELSYEARNDSLKDRIVPWIRAGQDPSKLDVRHELAGRLQVHQEGTCSWILKNSGYTQWYTSSDSSVLWYNAAPGSGKTILASTVINRLRQDGQRVIYHFCSYDDPTLRQPLNIFRSLALQLLRLAERVPDGLRKIWEEEQENFAPMMTNPSVAERVAHELLKVIPRVHVVIDGLDECLHAQGVPSGISALGIIEHLATLGSQRHGICKWLLTSRREGRIETSMLSLNAIEVTPASEDLKVDITSYIEERLRASQSTWCRKCIAEAADGNFLYAKLRVDTLLQEGLTCEEDIHEEMTTWPKGLTGCYLRSLEGLKSRSTREQEFARHVSLPVDVTVFASELLTNTKHRRTILILVTTMQPLSLNELRDALAVRFDSTDYATTRLPSPSLIQELCGSFISLDRSVRGRSGNPIVKLSHKSVQDLFSSDPNEVGVVEHLQKYFVSREDGSREMARICLAYLQYQRYSSPSGLPDDFETNPEHAFLRYAAVFWFQHLNDLEKPTPKIREEVRAFLQTPFVWNCVRVQSRVARHLFTRYVRSPSRGYNIRLQGSGWGIVDHIPTTIPVWMDEDDESGDRELVREFHCFMLEWSEALASGRDALLQCPMRTSGAEAFPGRSKFLDKCIKRANIGPQLSLHGRELMVERIFTDKGVFKARLFHRTTNAPGDIIWAVIAPFSKQPGPSGSFALPDTMLSHTFGHLHQGSAPSLTGAFGFDLGKPEAIIVTKEGSRTFTPPQDVEKIVSQSNTSNHWCIAALVRRPAGNSCEGVVALHLGLVLHQPQVQELVKEVDDSSSLDSESDEDEYDEEEEEEEDEDEEEEEEEPDSGSAENSSRTESSSEESSPDNESCDSPRNMLVILTQKGNPIWIPQCSASAVRTQLTGAFHPTKDIFAWILNSRELCLTDTSTGTVRKHTLPEAPNESSSVPPPSAAVRELQFSSDGSILHYLSVAFQGQNEQLTTARLAISSFHLSFDEQDNLGTASEFKLCCNPVMATYQFDQPLESLPMPLATIHWDTKLNTAYALLPVISCSVKVLKISLFSPTNEADQLQQIQTLSRPIFIPCSTNRRWPKILYQASPSKPDDSLYLVLDSHGGPENEGAGWPTVIRWMIPKVDGWRAWDEEEDGKCEELKRDPNISLQQMVKGSFVDANKVFGVAIRGALDYTKRGFLSCY
ncbi:hypothetical protein QBC44DRAFT_368800 [Cladorrhinum sp. PSN332]|nr:hypothetical protein QBC44DRAFT_368800 [Cladorrhinum sp. PSN332]